MSVPAGFGEDGMPIGLQLIGNYFQESRLLNAAHRLQQRIPLLAAQFDRVGLATGDEAIGAGGADD